MKNRLAVENISKTDAGIPLNLVFPKIKLFRKIEFNIPQNRGIPQNQVIPQSPDIYYTFSVFRKVQLALEIGNYKVQLPLNTKLQFNTSYYYQDMGNFMFSLSSK